MWESFRKIGFFLAVLLISAGIYLVMYAEKDVQQNMLKLSLNLMGDKLLAMVPEGADKNKLTELYEDFKQRVINGSVAPEQIENVAANILNVSNTETTITSQQAGGILRLAMVAPVPEVSAIGHVEPPPIPEHPEWENLGQRVKIMFEFNEQMHDAIKEQPEKRREFLKQIHYQVKDGLNLVVDTNLKQQMDEKEFIILAKEFKYLEQQELLAWQENLEVELEKEMKGMLEELGALQESLEEHKSKHIIVVLEDLEALKSLEYLEYLPTINADSIRIVVEKSLREAGIPAQHQKPEKPND